MARRDYMLEATLAWDDERRDAIDRIWFRCKSDGITGPQAIVRAIRRDLPNEMRPLVAVDVEVA